jgi:hypothetical protein
VALNCSYPDYTPVFLIEFIKLPLVFLRLVVLPQQAFFFLFQRLEFFWGKSGFYQSIEEVFQVIPLDFCPSSKVSIV